MVLSMLNQLCLGPVREPQEVDVFGEGREFSASSLESLLALVHDEANSEIVPYSPKNQLCIHLFNNQTVYYWQYSVLKSVNIINGQKVQTKGDGKCHIN